MNTTKHLAFALALTVFVGLLASAQAQTPRVTTVNLTTEPDRVHLAAQGDVAEIRLEVINEAGEVVFESGQITGQTLDWNMRDTQGERVTAGTYLVTITFRNAAGKLRKRVEQVTVAEDEKSGTKPAAPEAVQATVTTSGTTTAGKIPKFASVSASAVTVTNSVITESAGRIGIGTAAPAAKLTVVGQIQTTGAGAGIKFPDNSIQVKAGLTAVAHNTTLSGAGTSASPLTIAPLGVGNGQLANGAVTGAKIAVPLAISGTNPNPILSVSNAGGGAAISATGDINTSTQYNIGGQRVLSIAGALNTFAGVNAGDSNVGGGANAFFGYQAGKSNDAGNNNAFYGYFAGKANTNGSFNSFFGPSAGQNATGSYNAFFGTNAGQSVTGLYNSGLGTFAGSGNLTGDYNVYAGYSAGASQTNGSNNTFIGSYATGTNGITGATAIGAFSLVEQSNSVVLGSTDTMIGIRTSTPKTALHIGSGDVYIPSGVIIIKSPNGSCWDIIVSDTGELSAAGRMTCPN